jgi:hypothetical protein
MMRPVFVRGNPWEPFCSTLRHIKAGRTRRDESSAHGEFFSGWINPSLASDRKIMSHEDRETFYSVLRTYDVIFGVNK